MDAFTQHDAQELNRILCDRLEEQMKGTPMDGSIKRLFEGEMENYIECMDMMTNPCAQSAGRAHPEHGNKKMYAKMYAIMIHKVCQNNSKSMRTKF